MSKESCARPGGCSKARCKRESWLITQRLTLAWQKNYGHGCRGSKGDPVAGFFCWGWAEIFEDALKNSNLSCFSSAKWAAYPLAAGGTVHYYLWVSLGDKYERECSVIFDDGFLGTTARPGDDFFTDDERGE